MSFESMLVALIKCGFVCDVPTDPLFLPAVALELFFVFCHQIR